MKLKRSVVGLFAVAAFIGCSAFACNKYHTAVVVEHDFTVAVKSFQDGETALFQAGNITAVEHKNIEGKVAQVAVVGQAVNTLITSNATKQSVGAETKLLLAAISDLNTNGVLQVKNPQSQKNLQIALQAISDIAQNLVTALGVQ